MAHTVTPPALFLEHATRLRARRLDQVARNIGSSLRIHAVEEIPVKPARRDLSSVLRHIKGRLL